MKKKGFILCLVLALTMMATAVFAADGITVRIDSKNVEFDDEIGAPFIDGNNRTLVPFRAALEAYGAEIQWDGATKTAKAIKDDITIEVPVGEKYIVKNGERIENDTAATIKDNRTYLPIRKVMEAFGADVQWDNSLRTVVVTSEPFDAKSKVMDAYEKSYAWENYDMYILMNMLMAVPDEAGNIEEMDMQLDMNATAFMDPIKIKTDANIVLDVAGNKLSQPIMEMYMVIEDDKYITYTGMSDPITGELTWVKQEVEDENLSELLDPNNEEMKSLNEKSIKEVNFLGIYTDGDRNLEKYQVTVTFEGFDAIMKQSMSLVSDTLSDEDLQMSLDLISNLDDMEYILYIDAATGEFTKMEMDMTPVLKSILEQTINTMGNQSELPEGLTEEQMEEFNDQFNEFMKTMSIEMDMLAEYLNINSAEDFEIPQEALNAMTMEEYLEELTKELEALEEFEEPALEEATE